MIDGWDFYGAYPTAREAQQVVTAARKAAKFLSPAFTYLSKQSARPGFTQARHTGVRGRIVGSGFKRPPWRKYLAKTKAFRKLRRQGKSKRQALASVNLSMPNYTKQGRTGLRRTRKHYPKRRVKRARKSSSGYTLMKNIHKKHLTIPYCHKVPMFMTPTQDPPADCIDTFNIPYTTTGRNSWSWNKRWLMNLGWSYGDHLVSAKSSAYTIPYGMNIMQNPSDSSSTVTHSTTIFDKRYCAGQWVNNMGKEGTTQQTQREQCVPQDHTDYDFYRIKYVELRFKNKRNTVPHGSHSVPINADGTVDDDPYTAVRDKAYLYWIHPTHFGPILGDASYQTNANVFKEKAGRNRWCVDSTAPAVIRFKPKIIKTLESKADGGTTLDRDYVITPQHWMRTDSSNYYKMYGPLFMLDTGDDTLPAAGTSSSISPAFPQRASWATASDAAIIAAFQGTIDFDDVMVETYIIYEYKGRKTRNSG